MGKRELFLNQARAWLGYNEEDNSFKKIIDVYNGGLAKNVTRWGTRNIKMDYKWHWCSCFVSACAIATGTDDIVPIEIACTSHRAIAQKFGIWQENDAYVPAPGDLILYDWDDSGVGDNKGAEDHIGIVEKCDGKTITTIEGNGQGKTVNGNYLGKVYRNSRQVNSRYIRGFITPKWPDAADDTTPTPTPDKTIEELAAEVWAGKWGNGEERKRRLTEAGYDYAAVQALVNKQAKEKEAAKKMNYRVQAGAFNKKEDAVSLIKTLKDAGFNAILLDFDTCKEVSIEDKKEDIIHIVVKGDTLWGIAQKYLGAGSRYMEIAKYNNITNPSIINVGQKIRIPQ